MWVLEKVIQTKKGPRTYNYWMASWREGDRTRNVHIGSCAKMNAEAAIKKAKAMKAASFGLQ